MIQSEDLIVPDQTQTLLSTTHTGVPAVPLQMVPRYIHTQEPSQQWSGDTSVTGQIPNQMFQPTQYAATGEMSQTPLMSPHQFQEQYAATLNYLTTTPTAYANPMYVQPAQYTYYNQTDPAQAAMMLEQAQSASGYMPMYYSYAGTDMALAHGYALQNGADMRTSAMQFSDGSMQTAAAIQDSHFKRWAFAQSKLRASPKIFEPNTKTTTGKMTNVSTAELDAASKLWKPKAKSCTHTTPKPGTPTPVTSGHTATLTSGHTTTATVPCASTVTNPCNTPVSSGHLEAGASVWPSVGEEKSALPTEEKCTGVQDKSYIPSSEEWTNSTTVNSPNVVTVQTDFGSLKIDDSTDAKESKSENDERYEGEIPMPDITPKSGVSAGSTSMPPGFGSTQCQFPDFSKSQPTVSDLKIPTDPNAFAKQSFVPQHPESQSTGHMGPANPAYLGSRQWNRGVCKFFSEGKECKFGKQCKFVHQQRREQKGPREGGNDICHYYLGYDRKCRWGEGCKFRHITNSEMTPHELIQYQRHLTFIDQAVSHSRSSSLSSISDKQGENSDEAVRPPVVDRAFHFDRADRLSVPTLPTRIPYSQEGAARALCSQGGGMVDLKVDGTAGGLPETANCERPNRIDRQESMDSNTSAGSSKKYRDNSGRVLPRSAVPCKYFSGGAGSGVCWRADQCQFAHVGSEGGAGATGAGSMKLAADGGKLVGNDSPQRSNQISQQGESTNYKGKSNWNSDTILV